MSNEKKDALAKSEKISVAVGRVTGGLVPTTFEALYKMASIMAASGMMPHGVDSVEKVFVAVQMGMEVGLSPMQSVQNIAVINGRPCIWGDATVALVLASGLEAKSRETPLYDDQGNLVGYEVYGQRVGGRESKHRFTIEDSKRAKLWDNPKKDPWVKYPQRMLLWRARSWVYRDLYADVLKGLHIAEEFDSTKIDDVVYEAEVETLDSVEPISMPKALKAPEEPEKETIQDSGEQAEPSKDSSVVVGTISKMTSKDTKRGGTRHGIKIGDEWYGTFSESAVSIAKEAMSEDLAVRIEYVESESNGQTYLNIKTIEQTAPPED